MGSPDRCHQLEKEGTVFQQCVTIHARPPTSAGGNLGLRVLILQTRSERVSAVWLRYKRAGGEHEVEDFCVGNCDQSTCVPGDPGPGRGAATTTQERAPSLQVHRLRHVR